MSCEVTLRHEVSWWLQGCNHWNQLNLAWQGLTAWSHQLVSSERYSYFVVRSDGVALYDIMPASYEWCWARQSQSSEHFLLRQMWGQSWWTVHQGMCKHDVMPVWLRSCMTDFPASKKTKGIRPEHVLLYMSIITYLEKGIGFQNSSS
jgi:hypothetical protein